MSKDRVFVCALSAVAVALLFASTTQAQSWTSNASGYWSEAANWGGAVPPPGPTQQLSFSFATPVGVTTLTNDVADPYVLNSLTVVSTTTSAINFFGGALQFTGADAILRSSPTMTTNVFVNNDILFGAQGLTIMSSTVGTGPSNNSQLIINGDVTTLNTGLTTLTLDGSATGGANRITGVISDGVNGGSLGIFKQGTGVWSLTNPGNTFSGGLTIEAGTLRYDRIAALGAGQITLGTASATSLTLGYYGTANLTFDRDLYLDGSGVYSISSETTGRLTVNNTLHFLDLTPKTLRLVSGVTTTQHELQTQLINNGFQPLTLQKAGNGLWVVTNTNNQHTGGNDIIAGILRVSDTNLNLNLANANLRFSSTLNVVGVLETSGQFTAGIGTGAGQVQFMNVNGTSAGSGGWSAFGGALDVTLGGDSDTPIVWGGTANSSRLSLTTELQFNSVLSTDIVTFNNNLTLSSNNATQSHRINVSDNTASVNDWAVMTGDITGSGGIGKLGNGRLILTGNNDFTGGITIFAGQLQAADAQANLNLGNLKLVFTGTFTGTAGILQTSGNLNFSGLGTGAGQVAWLANGNGGFAAVGGALSVTLTTDTVTPIVWGTAPFYNGNTEFTANSINADNVMTWNNSIDLGGATRNFRINDNPATTADYAVIAGNLSNGGLNKIGAGLLELTGNNMFAGGITVQNGVLRGVNGATNLNLAGNNLSFNGSAAAPAVLETSGSYVGGVGTGVGQVQWVLITPTGANSNSGGWSAFGGALDVTLNNDADTALAWDGVNRSLLGSGELQFGSIYSDNVVTFHNRIDLNDGAHTIRVTDNVDNANDWTVITGVISSPTAASGRLIKQGNGKLILTGDSTFTGSTTIAGGTLQLGDGGTVGTLMGNIRLTTGSSAVPAYLVFNHSDVLQFGTATQGISGNSGAVIVDSPLGGGVQFNTAQAYSSLTSIVRGTLRYGVANAIPVANAVQIDAQGTLDLNGFAAGITTLSNGVGGAGVITNNGAANAILSLTQGLFSGVLQDGTTNSLGVTKLGGGTLVLDGVNTYGGGTTLAGGTLQALSGTALGTGFLRMTSGTFDAGPANIVYNNALILAGTSSLTGGGDVTFSGAGGAVAAATNFTFSNGGTLTIQDLTVSNTAIFNGSSNLVFAGTLTNNLGNRTLTINNSATTTFNDIRVSEAPDGTLINRTLTIWMADDANLVFAGNISNGTNTGNITITGAPTGPGGGTIRFTGDNNVRQIIIGGVGREVTVASGADVQQLSSAYLALTGTNNHFTVEAGGSLGSSAFAVSGLNTNIDILGSVGNGTITLTGSGSSFTVYSGGSVGNGAITLQDNTTFEIQAGGTVGNGAVALVNGATFVLDGLKGTGNGSLDNGSVLRGSGQAGGTWTMNAGSTLILGDVGGVATMTLGNLTLNGGLLRYDLGTNSDLLWLTTTGVPTINASTTIQITAGAGFGVGDYTLIDGFTGTMANLQRFNVLAPVGYKKSLTSANGELILHILLATTKTWSGEINNIWDDNVTANFGGQTYVNADNDAVAFFDGAANPNIQISAAGGLEPTSILVDNSVTTYTFSGDPIVGGAQLSKRGDGRLVLLNDNSFLGGVQLSGGTLQLGNGGTTGRLDPAAVIAMNNGAQLVIDRSDAIAFDGLISGTGSVVMNGGGTAQLSALNTFNGGLVVNAGTVETVNGGLLNEFGGWTVNSGGTLNISGTRGQVQELVTVNGGILNVNTSAVTATTLVVDGGGTVNIGAFTLTSPQTQLKSGVINITGTNVTFSSSTFGGGFGDTAIVNIGTGLTLSIWNTVTYTANNDAAIDPNGAIIQGAGVISLSGTRAFVINDSANADHDFTLAAAVTTGAWVKSGAGTLYVTGLNTSLSGMGLNGGLLILGTNDGLGAGTLTITTGTIMGDGVDRTVNNTVLARGSFTISGTSAIAFNQISNNASISLTFNNQALTTITTLVLAPTNTSSVGSIRGTGDVDFYNITAGTGTGNDSINFQGTGTYHLRGANTYLGVTSIRNGTVVVHDNNALNQSSGITMGVGGGTGQDPSLLLDGGITVDTPINVVNTGGSVITLGGATNVASTFAGNITFSQGINLSAIAGGTVVFSGTLDDGGSTVNGITKVGAGTVVLSGNNAFTGTAIVAEGTLQAGSTTALAAGAKLQLEPSGVFDLNGFNIVVGTLLDGTSGVGSLVNSGAAATITVGGGAYSGALGGATLGLVKNTAGTLTLAGTNTYSGATQVAAGTLVVSGAVANSAIAVDSGAVLLGGGAIGSTVNVAAGGVLGGSLTVAGAVTSAGAINPDGTLTVADLIINGGSLGFDLDTVASSDKILITGGNAPTVGGAATVNFTTGSLFDEGTYQLIGGYGANQIGGFANLSAPTTLSGLQTSLQNANGSLNLVVTTPHIVWTGASNQWNTTDANWSGDAALFANMAHSTFNNTAATTDVVVTAAGVTPHHVIIDNDDAHPYSFSGGAVQGTSLTKLGIGAVAITNEQTYARGVTISGGTLTVGDGGTLGGLTAPTVVNDGVLAFNRSDSYVFAANISGAGALIQNGSGTLALSGDNSYTGPTTINNGVLQVQGNLASSIYNNSFFATTVVSFSTGNTTMTGGVHGNLSFVQNGAGTTSLLGASTYTGSTVVNAGGLTIGGGLNGTSDVDVNAGGTFTVASGATVTTPGLILVSGSGNYGDPGSTAATFVANGTVNSNFVVVQQGGLLQGSGVINTDVIIETGGALAPGNSVESLQMNSLTLNHDVDVFFEFRNALGTLPGTDWDFIDLGGGTLNIDANNIQPDHTIKVFINSLTLDGLAHGGGVGDANFNGFDASPGTEGNITEYDWLFIKAGNISVLDALPGSVEGRFEVIDDVAGAGVFGTGNPFERPSSSLGQGRFTVRQVGTDLYIHYSAIPEPSSMILAGLGSLAAGWYGRRRIKNRAHSATT